MAAVVASQPTNEKGGADVTSSDDVCDALAAMSVSRGPSKSHSLDLPDTKDDVKPTFRKTVSVPENSDLDVLIAATKNISLKDAQDELKTVKEGGEEEEKPGNKSREDDKHRPPRKEPVEVLEEERREEHRKQPQEQQAELKPHGPYEGVRVGGQVFHDLGHGYTMDVPNLHGKRGMEDDDVGFEKFTRPLDLLGQGMTPSPPYLGPVMSPDQMVPDSTVPGYPVSPQHAPGSITKERLRQKILGGRTEVPSFPEATLPPSSEITWDIVNEVITEDLQDKIQPPGHATTIYDIADSSTALHANGMAPRPAPQRQQPASSGPAAVILIPPNSKQAILIRTTNNQHPTQVSQPLFVTSNPPMPNSNLRPILPKSTQQQQLQQHMMRTQNNMQHQLQNSMVPQVQPSQLRNAVSSQPPNIPAQVQNMVSQPQNMAPLHSSVPSPLQNALQSQQMSMQQVPQQSQIPQMGGNYNSGATDIMRNLARKMSSDTITSSPQQPSGHLKQCRFFINQLSDEKFKNMDKHGNTVLMSAVNARKYYLAKAALERLQREGERLGRADFLERYISRPNLEGKTPLYAAVEKNQGEMVALLLHYGADPNLAAALENEGLVLPLHCAAASPLRRQALEQLLASSKTGLEAMDSCGMTVLLHALAGHRPYSPQTSDNTFSIRLLLERGITTDSNDIQGKTSLMYAVETGDDNIVELLLSKPESGKMVNSKVNGNTILHVVASSSSIPHESQVRMLQLLRKRGADCKVLNNDGLPACRMTDIPEVQNAAGYAVVTQGVSRDATPGYHSPSRYTPGSPAHLYSPSQQHHYMPPHQPPYSSPSHQQTYYNMDYSQHQQQAAASSVSMTYSRAVPSASTGGTVQQRHFPPQSSPLISSASPAQPGVDALLENFSPMMPQIPVPVEAYQQLSPGDYRPQGSPADVTSYSPAATPGSQAASVVSDHSLLDDADLQLSPEQAELLDPNELYNMVNVM